MDNIFFILLTIRIISINIVIIEKYEFTLYQIMSVKIDHL